MKALTHFNLWLIVIIIFLFNSCNEDETEISKSQIVKEKLTGYVQKGPYINGTSILMSELDENLNQTGNIFTTQIIDNKGTFEISNIELSSQYVKFKADGFYYDEVQGEKSNTPLTLYALSNINDKSSVNVNILTHLEKSRVEYLIGHDISFSEAKDSTQKEILTIFGFENDEISDSETLDISIDNEENAILLAVSVILQGNNTVADLTEVLANISTDIREDGILNSEKIRSSLYNVAQTINLAGVREHIEMRYEELGIMATIPDFEQKINDYLISQKPFAIKDSVTNVTCNGANNGSIDITIDEGNALYIFLWSNGETTEDIGNLSPGSYSVKITDANNYHLKKENILVTEPALLSIDVTESHVTTIGGADAKIDIEVSGGTPPYTYVWSNGSTNEDLTNITTGIYTITVTDSNKCEQFQKITIHQPIELLFNKIDINCFGEANGVVDMTINGGTPPYAIIWSNGETTEDIFNLEAKTFSVKVEDSYGAIINNEITISQPDPLSIISEITKTVDDNNAGSINLSLSGGTQPFTFSWSNNETTEDIFNLQSGKYTVIITDANLCSKTIELTVENVVFDIDGNDYKTVKIDGNTWMLENLKTKHYNNGEPIQIITEENSWTNATIGAYCWYNNDISIQDSLGALYNWYTIADTRNICPTGWHVPSDEEWTTIEYLIPCEYLGSCLFVTQFGGTRENWGNFRDADSYGLWWSSSSFDLSLAWYRSSGDWFAQGNRNHADKHFGFSIRCIKD